MALQFVLGNSGSGKTHYLHHNILKMADAAPNKNFLVIVPEQFTMQTQRELVERHPRHSILNIDVQSFARLAYRVFDELGSFRYQVLEETGKNLILRRVAEEKGNELTVLKKNMTKPGYIGEVKSLISELAQYHVTPAQLSEAIEKLPEGSFSYKLKDVRSMYQGFLEFLEGRFVTAEEVLELLADIAGESELLKNSTVVLDGFTGFTPVQNLFLEKLMGIAEEIYVAVTIDIRENPYYCAGSHELFAMSKKMIASLTKMADACHVPVKKPVMLKHTARSRFHASGPLYFLEQNLFRNRRDRYVLNGEEGIFVSGYKNPREELHHTAREIERLGRGRGYRYNEIAIVCGDLPGYANVAKEVFAAYRIPLFIDQKVTIAYHPFIEFVRAAIEVVTTDFSAESVFRYVRNGLSGISRDDADILENYVLASGAAGHKKWSGLFCYLPRGYEEESLAKINEIRGRVWEQFEAFWETFGRRGMTAGEQTAALYKFICGQDIQSKLEQKERAYEAAGDLKNAKEYAQIYRIVMDLFDKLAELLGDEEISPAEYAKILDAGFESAKVGILPPGYDRVLFGDIERTRLDGIKALFFIGVNDGIIPRAKGADGILSQMERETLLGFQLELAPTEREKTFIQKFYLYLNLTKPSDRLYLSYARVDGAGKAMRCSYLIHTVLRLYENLSVREVEKEPLSERIVTAEHAKDLLIEGLESAAEWLDENREEDIRYWAALSRWYGKRETYQKEVEALLRAAKQTHQDTPISSAVTKLLYGTVLENSVTRLETFASCAFSHFLTYGLTLQERNVSAFSAVDFGTIFHEVLERFAEGIQKKQYSWFTISEPESEALLKEAMEQALLANHNLALYESARSSYAKERMYRILRRTVRALLYQVRQGKFVPDGFEVSFSYTEDLQSVHFHLGEDEKMHLRGRIDRIDTYADENKLYVKVIDYKSGNQSFQFLNVYYGLKLQLVVYMNAALELMQRRHPEQTAVPAGMFYYRIDDPMVDAEEALDEEELRRQIFRKLKLNGIVNSEQAVIETMDTALAGEGSITSDVIPVGRNKDGSLKKTSRAVTEEAFAALSSYVNETILHLGRRMMQGEISVSPYALAGKTGCDYCEFRAVCHFDPRMPGFAYRRLSELTDEEALCKMEQAKEDG